MNSWPQWASLIGVALLIIDRIFLSGQWTSTRETTETDLAKEVARLRVEIDRLHEKASEFGNHMQVWLDKFVARLGVMDTEIAVVKRDLQRLREDRA